MATPLKDGLGKPALMRLAANLRQAWPQFDADDYVTATLPGLKPLELKERVGHAADKLALYLPADYAAAIDIIVRASETWNAGDANDPLRGFAAWPLFHFIQHHGTHDFTRSMAALRSITHLFTGEYAIRPFITNSPKRAFAELTRWTKDSREHVRRLASEGCRPRLPWAPLLPDLVKNPAPVIALLERLKDDPAKYVRRSVANNLNDIAKDHPDLILDVCQSWLDGATADRRWIIERATRTLVKQGHPRVWGLLGFTTRPRVAVSAIELATDRVTLGNVLTFSFNLSSRSREAQRLVVDYAVHFMLANGKTRPKVFKLKVVELEQRQQLTLAGRVSFRPISTRSYHLGQHAIEILVNGQPLARQDFELQAPR